MASELRVERTEQFPSLAPSINFTDEPGVNEQGRPAAYPEIDCLRRQLAADVIAEAEQRTVAVGVGADRVLITGGTVSEEDYLRTLANSLGLTFDSLDGITRARCPLDDERLIESAAAGMLPLQAFCAVGDDLACVQACLGVDNTTDSWLARSTPPNMPANSTCSCPVSPRCICRCHSAARPTISAVLWRKRHAAWGIGVTLLMVISLLCI